MAHRSIVPTFYRLMGAYLGVGLLWGGVLGLSTSHLAHGASGHLALKHKKKSKTLQGAGGVPGWVSSSGASSSRPRAS